MDHILPIRSSTSGQLGCLHLSAIVNNAAINTICKYLFKIPLSVLWGEYPEAELLHRMVVLYLISQGTSILFSTEDAHTVLHSRQHTRAPHSPRPCQHLLFSVLSVVAAHPNGSLWFDVYFSGVYCCWAPFHMPVGHFFFFFEPLSPNCQNFFQKCCASWNAHQEREGISPCF